MDRNQKTERLSVFGLGKLGCTMMACFAHKGWPVVGVDVDEGFVKKINEGTSPIFEPGVDELIKANRSRISATLDPQEAIFDSDVSFIVVPTPSVEDGSFSIEYVTAVAGEIGSILRSKEDYHLIVVTSTVLPGDTAAITNLLEKTSGKKSGEGFGVCYNPDFIALGSVVRDFLNPDMILVGESDDRAGAILENIHEKLVDNSPNIHRMSFHNAELTKIALNSYCTLKITFANSLAAFCDRLPGGNVDQVTDALGDDTRIGRKYLKGGLSYGGPCFPRDNRAIAYSAGKFGVTLPFARVTDEVNNYQRTDRIPNILQGILKKHGESRISVLGLTYKPDTTLVEESASIYIIRELARQGVDVITYDPAGMGEAEDALGESGKISYAQSAEDCLRGSRVCFIATPWAEFREITRETFLDLMRDPIIFDAWSLYSFSKEDGIEYLEIGKNT